MLIHMAKWEMIFSIAHDDISHLKLFCEQELKHMELLNASGMETESYDENEWGQ